jgi:putative hydrolase of HD superfamily
LFHDLPEVLTKDIISPIKTFIKGLEDIIKDYEEDQMKNRLLPLLPVSWRKEMRYFTQDEFENKIKIDGKIINGISYDELNNLYNKNEFYPLDGKIIKACDKLTAFIGAYISIKHGITSKHLEEGRKNIMRNLKIKTFLESISDC